MKRIYFLLLIASAGVFFACNKSTESKTANKDKPVIFYNMKPTASQSQDIDMSIMNWNDRTFFVGSDAIGGGILQAQMITDYFNNTDIALADRNGDGVIGYVLCIGDMGHTDSTGRTEGVRKALGTWNGSPAPKNTVEGRLKAGGKEFKVVELDGRTMTGTDGTTWNANAATDAMGNWATKFGTAIDLVISNNDGMAMGCLQASNYPAGVPIFGYDAIPDALEAIKQGKLTGTISQNADGQIAAVLQLFRNFFDGLSAAEAVESGFSRPDKYGNQISCGITYDPEHKTLTVPNLAVTKENCDVFSQQIRDGGIHQTDAEAKKILCNTRSASDLFFATKYIPALRHYAPLLNLNVTLIQGDGQNESTILDAFTNLGRYDGYMIAPLRSSSARDYIDKLKY